MSNRPDIVMTTETWVEAGRRRKGTECEKQNTYGSTAPSLTSQGNLRTRERGLKSD